MVLDLLGTRPAVAPAVVAVQRYQGLPSLATDYHGCNSAPAVLVNLLCNGSSTIESLPAAGYELPPLVSCGLEILACVQSAGQVACACSCSSNSWVRATVARCCLLSRFYLPPGEWPSLPGGKARLHHCCCGGPAYARHLPGRNTRPTRHPRDMLIVRRDARQLQVMDVTLMTFSVTCQVSSMCSTVVGEDDARCFAGVHGPQVAKDA
jgi:hypothetical protein